MSKYSIIFFCFTFLRINYYSQFTPLELTDIKLSKAYYTKHINSEVYLKSHYRGWRSILVLNEDSTFKEDKYKGRNPILSAGYYTIKGDTLTTISDSILSDKFFKKFRRNTNKTWYPIIFYYKRKYLIKDNKLFYLETIYRNRKNNLIRL